MRKRTFEKLRHHRVHFLHVRYSFPGDTSDGTSWVEVGAGVVGPAPHGTCIKFRFVTPLQIQPSGPAPPQLALAEGVRPDYVRWLLLVEQCSTRRSWEFEIPVERNSGATLAEAVSDVPETGKTDAPPIAPSIVYRIPNPNWLTLCEISKGSPVKTILWTLLGLGCIVVGWKVRVNGWPFFLFGCAVLGSVGYALGARNDITVMQGFLVIRRWWFGYEIQKRTVKADRILQLEVNTHAALPAGYSTWSLDAMVNYGKDIWLVAGLEDSRQAYVLRRWIGLILEQGMAGALLEGELPLDEFIRERDE